jgi:predicted RNA-binding Zn-ribbon protein involved in translation (DUF1610 family)
MDDETGEGEDFGATRKKKRRRKPEDTDALRRARRKKRRSRLRREARVVPPPPLQDTDPLAAYLAGEMVPCPVGCGGFSEVVRVATRVDGAGDVWFECLSCAQRREYEVPKATPEEIRAVFRASEEGTEPACPRHGRHVPLRRRGRQFVCPECGVDFAEEEDART